MIHEIKRRFELPAKIRWVAVYVFARKRVALPGYFFLTFNDKGLKLHEINFPCGFDPGRGVTSVTPAFFWRII